MKTSVELNDTNNSNVTISSLVTCSSAGLSAQDDEPCPTLVDTAKISIVKELLSTVAFAELSDRVSEKTLQSIRQMNFTHMTEIQAKTIPHLLEGK